MITPLNEHQHSELTDALREELALYAFGMLEADSAAAMTLHLAEHGCSVCTAEFAGVSIIAGDLASAVAVLAPAPELKGRLLSRIREEEQAAPPGITVLRGTSGNWRNAPWDGIQYQRLYYDHVSGMMTSLVRIEPGKCYPAHRHGAVEQSWVVEGSCRMGSLAIRQGDFAWAAAGSQHDVLVSDEGCVLLILSSAKDEILV